MFHNIQWIFVDFDDTICLHTHWRPLTENCLNPNIQEATDALYAHAELNVPLCDYLIECQNNGAHVCLLTQASSIMLELKKCWLNNNCPDLHFERYISMASDEQTKAEIMELFAKYYHLSNDQLMLIDDKSIERWKAEAKGFVSANPQMIANILYKRQNKATL